MANPQHLAVLDLGEGPWNDWRQAHAGLVPDLSGADLRRRSLRNHDLSRCDLSFADCRDASFRRANLSHADLQSAKLYRAFFSGTELGGANLRQAILYETVFANVDLSAVQALEACRHKGPSVVDHRTLARSSAVPVAFLRGCGLPDLLIAEAGRADSGIRQAGSCFISYASADQAFAERLYDDLQSNGIRCWYAPKDMQIGAKIRDAIDEAIQQAAKVLLILSASALASDWVEKEFETAFDEERRRGGPILFPIRLDDAPLANHRGWVADIRRGRHIGDFSAWRERQGYQTAFSQLLKSLTQGGDA